jgi:hypothetical protein
MGSVPREINATQVGTRRAFPVPSIGLFLGLQVLDVLTTMIGLRLGAIGGHRGVPQSQAYSSLPQRVVRRGGSLECDNDRRAIRRPLKRDF